MTIMAEIALLTYGTCLKGLVKPGQFSHWGSCHSGAVVYLGSCPTWAVVLFEQLSAWAFVAWADVLAPSSAKLFKIGNNTQHTLPHQNFVNLKLRASKN